jgi:hypothetical protein
LPNVYIPILGIISIAFIITKLIRNVEFDKELDADIGAIRYFENMDKTNISEILYKNFEEAQKLVRKYGKPCKYPLEDMREIELPNGGVKVMIGTYEGKVTKVRTFDDELCGMEYCYEAEDEDVVEYDGWILDCEFAHGTENNIFLAIGEMFDK